MNWSINTRNLVQMIYCAACILVALNYVRRYVESSFHYVDGWIQNEVRHSWNSLQRYEKTFDVNGHLALYKQSKQSFDGRQMCALKLLYQWRDRIARERDESTGYRNHCSINYLHTLQIARMYYKNDHYPADSCYPTICWCKSLRYSPERCKGYWLVAIRFRLWYVKIYLTFINLSRRLVVNQSTKWVSRCCFCALNEEKHIRYSSCSWNRCLILKTFNR